MAKLEQGSKCLSEVSFPGCVNVECSGSEAAMNAFGKLRGDKEAQVLRAEF